MDKYPRRQDHVWFNKIVAVNSPFLCSSFYHPVSTTSVLKCSLMRALSLFLNRVEGVSVVCCMKSRGGCWPEGTVSYYSSNVLLFWPWASILNWIDSVNVQVNGTCLSDVWNAYCRPEKTPQPTASVLKAVCCSLSVKVMFYTFLAFKSQQNGVKFNGADHDPGRGTGVDDQIDEIRDEAQVDQCIFPAL